MVKEVWLLFKADANQRRTTQEFNSAAITVIDVPDHFSSTVTGQTFTINTQTPVLPQILSTCKCQLQYVSKTHS